MVRNALVPLMPNSWYFPDFVTPTSGLLDLTEGIESVVATPHTTVRHELTRLDQSTGTPGWDRHGNTVLHTITALGYALLEGSRRDRPGLFE